MKVGLHTLFSPVCMWKGAPYEGVYDTKPLVFEYARPPGGLSEAARDLWVDRSIALGRKPMLILYPQDDIAARVTRYKGKVREWEIGNEMSDTTDPKVYAEWLSRSYKTIKAIDPGATVITCGNQGHQNGGHATRWMHNVLENAFEDKDGKRTFFFDAVGVHLYASLSEIDRIPEMMSNVKSVIWAHLGKLCPIWNTEFGVLKPRFRSETRASQQDAIRRMMKHAQECAVSIWYAFDEDALGLGADTAELATSISTWNGAING